MFNKSINERLSVLGVKDLDIIYASEYSNKRIMILRDDNEIKSASDESKCESLSTLEDDKYICCQ
jgi:hypothetical protein